MIVVSPPPKILGVLGGDDFPVEVLRNWIGLSDIVVAADGGADLALAAGRTADIVVGDLDSLRADRRLFADVREDGSQMTTDCDKLLEVAAESGWASLTLTATEGSLPDHFVSTLQSASRSPLDVRFAFRRGIGAILRQGRRYRFAATGRVSLLPLAPARGVRMTGVRWPLENVTLEPLGFTSISNEAVGGHVELSMEEGYGFAFIERPISLGWPE